MKILGIDPGLEATGIALIEFDFSNLKVLLLDTLYTNDKYSLPEKFALIFNYIKNIVTSYSPDWMVIEEVFTQKYPFSATKIAQVQAILFLIAGLYNIPVKTYHPTEVKKAITGSGRANKEDIKNIVLSLFPVGGKDLSDHAIDALSLAYLLTIEMGNTGMFNVV